ncbi:hypothetical protein [Haloarcula litorea]|uniref:hypothetical protein n=1 Tax=Haloarcula litorea TaxID=3032579 RepID=UPI0023E84EA7|nr:hypothetical protein [Halomicroarcula sp. GDY20]
MDRRAVTVVACLLLAGCGGFAAGDRATVTPAPVPETRTVAPGVTTDGVVSPTALASAHEAALADTTYTLTLVERVGDRERRFALRVGRDGRFRYRGERFGERYSQTVFSDGRAEYRREQRPLGVRYEYEGPTDGTDGFGRITGRLIEAYLPTGPAQVGEREGGVAVTVARPPADAAGLENYTVGLSVTPAGLVRSFTLAFRDETRDVSISYRFRYSAVGETSVERPAWVDEQWGNASAVTPTATPVD